MPEPRRHADGRSRGAGRRRRRRAGAGHRLLVALLGFAISVQFKASNSDAELAAARPEDLVRILSDLDAQQERLRREISDLEDTQRQLDSGAQGRDAALAEARKRADELGILAGTLPAEGPGLSIEITPGTEKVQAAAILDAVEELRGAGAEAMQIDGHDGGTVRVVAATYFVDGRQRPAAGRRGASRHRIRSWSSGTGHHADRAEHPRRGRWTASRRTAVRSW